MQDFVEVAGIDELQQEGGLRVEIGGRQIGIFRVGDKVFAIENECPHRGGPLHEGLLEGLEVVCPWHAWTFHLGTGQCTFVEGVAVATYPVRVENGRILVSPIACEKD